MIITPYRPLIVSAASTYGLDPRLVEAVMTVESGGLTSAYRFEATFWVTYLSKLPQYATQVPARVSASYGLLQIMYVVALEVGVVLGEPEYLFVPTVGLDAGCRKLKQLLDWAGGNVTQALAAYNGGKRANAGAPYRNASYAAKVLAAKDRLL